jgi:hypothetical protein
MALASSDGDSGRVFFRVAFGDWVMARGGISLFLRVLLRRFRTEVVALTKIAMRREVVGTGRGWLNCSQWVGRLGFGAHRPHPHCALGRFALRTSHGSALGRGQRARGGYGGPWGWWRCFGGSSPPVAGRGRHRPGLKRHGHGHGTTLEQGRI